MEAYMWPLYLRELTQLHYYAGHLLRVHLNATLRIPFRNDSQKVYTVLVHWVLPNGIGNSGWEFSSLNPALGYENMTTS